MKTIIAATSGFVLTERGLLLSIITICPLHNRLGIVERPGPNPHADRSNGAFETTDRTHIWPCELHPKNDSDGPRYVPIPVREWANTAKP